jgi:hypothetical protein
LSLIDSLNRNKSRLRGNSGGTSPLDVRDRSNSGSATLDEPTRRQNQIEQVIKKQMSGIGGVQVDDRAFQTQLLESGVISPLIIQVFLHRLITLKGHEQSRSWKVECGCLTESGGGTVTE